MEKRKEFTNTEQARLQRILQIQELSKKGYSSCEIARRMGMDRRTVTKYRTGDASLLCRSYTRSCLHSHKDFILKCLQNGLTQAEIIRQLKKYIFVNLYHILRIVHLYLGTIEDILHVGYHWGVEQCEYATDVMFKSRELNPAVCYFQQFIKKKAKKD